MKIASNQQSVLDKARDYIKEISGVECGIVRHIGTDSITFVYDGQIFGHALTAISRRITAAIHVEPVLVKDHNGNCSTWVFDGHRINVSERFYSDNEFSLSLAYLK